MTGPACDRCGWEHSGRCPARSKMVPDGKGGRVKYRTFGDPPDPPDVQQTVHCRRCGSTNVLFPTISRWSREDNRFQVVEFTGNRNPDAPPVCDCGDCGENGPACTIEWPQRSQMIYSDMKEDE